MLFFKYIEEYLKFNYYFCICFHPGILMLQRLLIEQNSEKKREKLMEISFLCDKLTKMNLFVKKVQASN